MLKRIGRKKILRSLSIRPILFDWNIMGFFITVKNGLLDSKHFKAMHGDRNSGSVWLFLWLLDKMTIIDHEKGEGLVLGGKPIRFEEVQKGLGISRRTYAEYIKILRDAGYIKTTRTPYGLVIVVYKAFKVFGQKVNRDVSNSAHLKQRTAHILPTERRTSNKTIHKTIQKDNYPNFSSSKKNSSIKSKITTEPEDISEDVSINYDTGEVDDNRAVRKRSQGKDKVALGLQEYFRITCKQYTGVLPMKDKAGYFSVLRAMNEATMTEKEIKSMIDDWFEDGQDPGKEVQITACFSNWNINRFKALYQ